MTTTTQVDLVINKLTKAQYQEIATPSPTELYMVTDDSGITSAEVISALGYTPYNATNPNGYVTNASIGTGTLTITQGGVSKGTFNANSSSNTTIALDAGGSGSGVYVATYNVDTYQDVHDAYTNGDFIICTDGSGNYYYLGNFDGAGGFMFYLPTSSNTYYYCQLNSGGWSNGNGTIVSLSGYQTTANLVTSISNTSTDSQYPSAKCVYDIVGDIETLLQAV